MKKRRLTNENLTFAHVKSCAPELAKIATCFWYLNGCNTKDNKCANLDAPHIICPIKPEG
jgi:hypothetical protein